jgi:isopenicillin N synthase-like dioxygenase
MPNTSQLNYRDKARTLEQDDVPVIDCSALFSDSDSLRKNTISAIGEACRNIGFFYATNIGISPKTSAQVLSVMDEFFSLPDNHPTKQSAHTRNSSGDLGWTPLFGEPSYQEGTVAHVESFDCGPSLSAFSDESNLPSWVHPSVWPKTTGFHDTVRTYWDSGARFAQEFNKAIAEYLEIDKEFLNYHCSSKAPSTLRLLQYPGTDSPENDIDVGIAAHTDFESFTLLYQDQPGLELRGVDGHWYTAPQDPNSFVVILGDMMERWTNGWLQATGHRVPRTPWARRSIVMFFAADADCIVSPMPKFVSKSNPARFAPVTQHAYIKQEWDRASALRDDLTH